MPRQEDFTTASARRNRISQQTRSGYTSGLNQIKKWVVQAGLHDLLGPCSESRDGTTLDLNHFTYKHFLSFIEWTVENKDVEMGTISGYRSAIQSLYKDQGLRKSVAHGLQTGEKVYRGKRPMTFDLFESLCVKSMALNDGGFAHLFLDRFGKSLAALVCGGSSKAKKDIGTHSIRKGAATFVSSGSTGGPSIISVCLRCGWFLGNVMERYFRKLEKNEVILISMPAKILDGVRSIVEDHANTEQA
ncbi:hypothetical protein H257_16688 [Aphanomyces astaci]|uniref:Core-binding (CB) domain-containing protein n=1 Tax=Aphanomyces astaci TaxID=112090 RepID=W4FHL1_APHAT|nr:hypothetical protein H257_16688 [Aphanomyces astaci]ETV66997.1 hypothetical protein H257_16688 [Aphanomyces astaci]|eukprot:XP_009843514.1 hypothetical protein H257_16688 [Aphanomyces astaci]